MSEPVACFLYELIWVHLYLINTDDEKVIEYLKVFTFLSREEIEEIALEQQNAPEKRIAQQALAKEIITDLEDKGYKLPCGLIPMCEVVNKLNININYLQNMVWMEVK